MAGKLSIKDIATAYSAASIASLFLGVAEVVLLRDFGYSPDPSLTIVGTWALAVGLPSTFASAELIRRKLGQVLPPSVSVTGSHTGRRIPLNGVAGATHIFASLLPGPAAQAKHAAPPPTATDLVVSLDGVDTCLPLPDFEDFLYTAWRRQRQGQSGLSRTWWTRQRRPRLTRQAYDVRMTCLLSQPGLIRNRTQGRSGELTLSPKLTVQTITQGAGR